MTYFEHRYDGRVTSSDPAMSSSFARPVAASSATAMVAAFTMVACAMSFDRVPSLQGDTAPDVWSVIGVKGMRPQAQALECGDAAGLRHRRVAMPRNCVVLRPPPPNPWPEYRHRRERQELHNLPVWWPEPTLHEEIERGRADL